MAREITEQSETRRLNRIYKELPVGKKEIAAGLIAEAARLRVMLNRLWADIQENGTTEQFSQSPDADPYERERPVAKQYLAANKNYQTIIAALDKMVPQDAPGAKGSKLSKLMSMVQDDG